MLALLVLVFLVVPVAEIWVILQVGEAIGILPTVALLVLDSIIGSVLLRSQGRVVWRRFRDTVAAGRPPARELVDGVLVIFGGALLLAPGFLTDLLGLLLIAPPSRAMIRRALVRRLGSRLVLRTVGAAGNRRHGRWDDVDGSGVDLHPSGPARLR